MPLNTASYFAFREFPKCGKISLGSYLESKGDGRRVRQSVLIVAVLLVLLSAPALAAEGPKVGIDVFLGNSWHTRQAINVGGNVIYDPQWETRPFGDAWYYVARVRWGSIEVEWIHDKVFMGYDTPNVKGFNMSDGYNFVLMNAVQKWGHWEARLGAGPVLVHPEGTVNGYYIGGLGSPTWRLGGIGFQASLAYRDELWGPFAYVVEGKITSGVVHLTYPAPVNEIYAPVTGYHFVIGVGYDL